VRALANSFFHRHDRFSPKVYRIFILRFHNIWILTLVDIFENSLLLFYKVPRNHRFLESEHMGCCGHDRMVVGFTPIYAMSTYHHLSCEFKSHSGRVYSIQHYVIRLSVTSGRSDSGHSGFLNQYNWLPRYNWNIVESGIKHHNPNPRMRTL
jgi:hypothetical protein